jgi:hypothetical protein
MDSCEFMLLDAFSSNFSLDSKSVYLEDYIDELNTNLDLLTIVIQTGVFMCKATITVIDYLNPNLVSYLNYIDWFRKLT